MCMLCEMKKLEAEGMGAKIEEKVVGTLAPQYMADLDKLGEAEAKLEAEISAAMEAAVEAAVAKAEKAVEKKYGKKWEALQDLKRDTFKEGLLAAGIEHREAEYAVNRETGEIVMHQLVPKNAPGVH